MLPFELRHSQQQPQGPAYPEDRVALSLSPSSLPSFFDSLAKPANYSLASPTARARVKSALYNWALSPDSPVKHLFLPTPDSKGKGPAMAAPRTEASVDSHDIEDAWTLRSAQSQTFASSSAGLADTSTRGLPCGHVFKSGESVYRCRDCGIDATCVLCARCFHGSGHAKTGHDVTVSVHSGIGAGCCDCGDVEAWKEGCHTDCKYHGVDAGSSEMKGEQDLEQDDEELVEAALSHIRETLEVSLDWALDVLARSPTSFTSPRRAEDVTGPAPAVPSAPALDDDEDTNVTPRPPTAANLVAFIRERADAVPGMADLLQQVDDEGEEDIEADEQDLLDAENAEGAFRLPPNVERILEQLQQQNGDFVLGTNHRHPSSSPPANVASPLTDRPSTIHEPPFAVVLWNDERHSFAEVIDQVSRATGCSRAAASGVAQRVDLKGRDVVLISESAEECVRVAKRIGVIELGVTVRSAIDTWREQVAVEIVLLSLSDLLHCRVGRGADGHKRMKELVAGVWLDRKKGGDRKSRFQGWAQIEERLWKEPRKGFQEGAIGLMGASADVRLKLSIQYAEIYSSLAESYLLSDREPENSFIFFGVQVFTVPSVSAHLIDKEDFFETILEVLVSFFTGQLTEDKKHLVLPPEPSFGTEVNLDSPLLSKQKRYFQLFNDLQHLISSPLAQKALFKWTALHAQVIELFGLFHNMNAQTRAVGTHVEYENDQWITAFNLTIQLARLARTLGEAKRTWIVAGVSDQSPGYEFQRALQGVLTHLLLHPFWDIAAERGIWRGIALLPASAGESSVGLALENRISTRPVSFHHPLHWLLAELFKGLTAWPIMREWVSSLGWNGTRDWIFGLLEVRPELSSLQAFLCIMDVPLSTVVLVAQIRAGIWVRNGFGIRAQNLHYRDYSLRETTYEQDVFFLQTALILLEPSEFIVPLIDRFELRDWLAENSVPPNAGFEPEQALALLDEMLSLVITLVTDPTYVAPLSDAGALRRELLHYLSFGPTTYSDLIRRISERFSDDPKIDRILSEIGSFKPPSGTNDQGLYNLREELLDEIDPWFARYTKNQREEAGKILKAALRKKGKMAASNPDPVIVPRRLVISPDTSGPFVDLPRILGSDALLLVVYHAVRAGQALQPLSPPAELADEVESPPPPYFSESVVDQALQLALLACVEQPDAFTAFAVRSLPVTIDGCAEDSLAHALVRVEEDERLSAVWPKAKWLLDRLAERHGPLISSLRKQPGMVGEQSGPSSEAQAAEAKKAAAKARQAAIMKQFQQAQSAFLQNVDGEEDEDEEFAMEDDHQAEAAAYKIDFGSCIVCQDQLEDSATFGTLAFVQGSSLIRVHPVGEENGAAYQDELLAVPTSLDRALSDRPYGVAGRKDGLVDRSVVGEDGLAHGFPQCTRSGMYASSCGHMMHLACFEDYVRSLEQRHHQQRMRNHPENLERREFICPLCKSLGNVLLPAKSDSPAFQLYRGHFDSRTLTEWSQADADPIEEGATLDQFDETLAKRVDKLSLRFDNGKSAFKPWRATMALPMLLPGHFNENEGRMIARLLQVVTALQSEIGGPHNAIATLSQDVMSYTVSCLEIATRGTDEPSWAISDANLRLVQSFSGVLHSLTRLMTQSVESERIAAVSVRQRLGGIFSRNSQFADVEFTNVDPLNSVLEAAVCVPSAFYHVVSVAFYTSLAQNLLSIYKSWCNSNGEVQVLTAKDVPDAERAEYLTLARIRNVFFPDVDALVLAVHDLDPADINLTLGKHLHAQATVFLRRVTIVARAILGFTPDAAASDNRTELSRLLDLLRVPLPHHVLSSAVASPNADVVTLRQHISACRESMRKTLTAKSDDADSRTADEAADALTSDSSIVPLEHVVPYELLGLPDKLDTLLALSIEAKCKRCDGAPENPALCLFCGEMLCAQSFCCMVGEEDAAHGECNEHMWTCAGSVGLYYLIKRNAILYLHADRGAFSTPPYLDSHGEVDVGARRIRSQFPQFLHRGRYDELRKLWLSQGIPTFIARKLDAITDQGGWTTF
ncbi:E3 ubiquitin-protein ligase UBR1 [Rhodotorula toruloides]|uniref:E3 ubiquitin-protein ligase n=1 Tax=Rhodotorula toruloides TaxID=5286 RepID=A0A511KJ50_RHOTO|nr:E3 ubiquitin-protein ligase UBR1 [Rhodotorula toruloides]